MPEKKDADSQGGDSPDYSIDPLVKAYIDAEIEKAREHEDAPRKKKWKNSWRAASPITRGTFMLTVGIAFSTIAYAIIAAFQLGAMKDQLREIRHSSDESSKQFQVQLGHFDAGLGRSDVIAQRAGEQAAASARFADAAKTQAGTSKDSLRQTIDDFRLDQRAWLTIKNVQLTKPFSTTEHAQISIDIGNSGKTPALNAGVVCVGFDLTVPPCKPLSQPLIFKFVVAPGGQTIQFASLDPQSQALLDALKSKTKLFYFRFQITYYDIYRNERHTMFCGTYPGEKDPYFTNCTDGGTMD